jgi:hypothetical protein
MEDMSPALKKRLMMLMMNPEFKGMPMDKLIEEAENQLRQDSFRSKEGPLLEAKDGGRVEYQTGRITESRVLPPECIEAAQRTFLTDLATQAGMPSVTTATAKQPGETDAQFAQRQAQATQFGITKAGMAELAPQVAGETQLQKDARGLASGLGSFQPFLTDPAPVPAPVPVNPVAAVAAVAASVKNG